MKRITEITRRDIIEIFCKGYIESDWLIDEKYFYQYHGRLTELDFLEKIYPLEDMPSCDPQFKNAKEDIWQHTINNDDYEFGWVFNDDRFGLLKGYDALLLNFLCAVFHPENRNEREPWNKYLKKIDDLIRMDGYEFYVSDKISGRDIYSWRKLSEEEVSTRKFQPFSIRHKVAIEKGIIKVSIPKRVRREVVNVFSKYNEFVYKTTETNWSYSVSMKEAVLDDIKEDYYIPKCFGEHNKYIETDSIENFILDNYPYMVFDAIELFAGYNQNNDYARNINKLLQSNGFEYKLLDGKIDLFQKQIRGLNDFKAKKTLGQSIFMDKEIYAYNGVGNKEVNVGNTICLSEENVVDKAPVVFISYSWDGEEHKKWVLDLATKLREKGVDVLLDTWDLGPLGSPLPYFMEQSIAKSNRVICILTPNYKKKTDDCSGGVGYEFSIISSNIFNDSKNRTKFIPLLRSGSTESSVPDALGGSSYIDMSNDICFENSLEKLLRDIFCEPELKKPPLGKRPKF